MALCSNCGHDKGEGSYCGGCGQKSGAQPQQPQYQQPQYQQPQYQQPQYQQPQYQQPQFGFVAQPRTNSMAIASFVVSLICCGPLGVIFGHIALGQIAKTGEGGKGLATAGLVIGYISLAFGVLFVIGALGSSSSGY
jgi:hypothetical protein